MAMLEEAKPVLNKLKCQQIDNLLPSALPATLHKASLPLNNEVFIAISNNCAKYGVPRVGSQAAAILAWEAIRAVQPAIVINAGTAGGLQTMGAHIGDVFISSESIKYHDRNFHPTNNEFYNYSIGFYPCLNMSHIAEQFDLKTGIVSSGNSMLSSEKESRQIKENRASIKEMEAAAIAEVAQLLDIPFIALKIVTDIIDIDLCPQKQFDNNLCDATEKLATVIKNVISSI